MQSDKNWSYRIYGTPTPEGTEELNITPSTNDQIKIGLFNKVTIHGDNNLLPENIKKGISIFGVEGSYEGDTTVKHTVIFDSDGGTAIPLQLIKNGELVTEPLPTKDGYDFLYWSYNGEEYDFTIPITKDISLLAIWELSQIVNYTSLYNRGDECADITGGWNGYACTTSEFPNYNKMSPSLTKNTDHLNVTQNKSNALGALLTANKIDVSEYTKCSIYGYFSSRGDQYAWQQLCMLNGNSGIVNTLAPSIYCVSNSEATKIVSMDLSNVTDSGHIGILYYYYGVTSKTNLYYAVLLKEDDWLSVSVLAGIAAESIDDLLSNSAILLTNKEAVEYMVKKCTGVFMMSAIQSETFMTALNNSAFKDIVYSNEHWAKFLI